MSAGIGGGWKATDGIPSVKALTRELLQKKRAEYERSLYGGGYTWDDGGLTPEALAEYEAKAYIRNLVTQHKLDATLAEVPSLTPPNPLDAELVDVDAPTAQLCEINGVEFRIPQGKSRVPKPFAELYWSAFPREGSKDA